MLNSIEQLNGLIATLDYQEKVKKDYVTPSSQIFFLDGQLITSHDKEIVYMPTKIFHSQMANKLDIPAGYYNKMLSDAKGLLDNNVNHWLSNQSKNFLLRTFETGAGCFNEARAFLSDSYSIIDNYQVLIEALEAIKATGVKIEIEGAELSDTKMYLKVVCPEVEIKATEMLKAYRLSIEKGMGIISGFVLKNSEVGSGSFSISPRAKVLACNNGMVVTKDELKRVHLGSKMDELGFNKNERVMRANLRLIKEQISHAVKIFLSKEYLNKLVDSYTLQGEPKIEAPIQNVIQVVGKKFDINEERRANILKYFVEGGDTRRIGLINAMTYECQGLKDVDQKNETEVASYEVLQNFKAIEGEAFRIKSN